MKLFFLGGQKNYEIKKSFEKAIFTRGGDLIDVDIDNFVREDIVGEKGLIYRAKTGEKASLIESMLLLDNDFKSLHVGGFNGSKVRTGLHQIMIFEREGISTPYTFYPCNYSKDDLKKIGKLLGFPVIVKVSGLSHGGGVMICDSEQGLCSLIGYLGSEGKNYMIKKHIKSEYSTRLIMGITK